MDKERLSISKLVALKMQLGIFPSTEKRYNVEAMMATLDTTKGTFTIGKAPNGAIALGVVAVVSTEYSAGTTIKAGQDAESDDFTGTGITATTAGTYVMLPFVTLTADADIKIIVANAGAVAAGAAKLLFFFATPRA